MSDPKQNLRDLRDLIAGLPEKRFDMRTLAAVADPHGDLDEHSIASLNGGCDTCGCIAGWALALKIAKEGGPLSTWGLDRDDAADWLGLNSDEGLQLFLPAHWKTAGYYTKADALATLDHLIETGEVKWANKFGEPA